MTDHFIDEPGIYDMEPEQYHADPVIQPSLSASIAKRLIDRSPWHEQRWIEREDSGDCEAAYAVLEALGPRPERDQRPAPFDDDEQRDAFGLLPIEEESR